MEQGKEGQRDSETIFRVEGFRVFPGTGGSEVRSGTGRGSANARLEHGATGVAHLHTSSRACSDRNTGSGKVATTHKTRSRRAESAA